MKNIVYQINGFTGDSYANFATSISLPNGEPPKSTKARKLPNYGDTSSEQQQDEEDNRAGRAYSNWLCRHNVDKITDGDAKTAWCSSGAPSDINEFLLVSPFHDPFPVDESEIEKKRYLIHAGFGKNKKTFDENARPKKIRVHVYLLSGYSEVSDTIETGSRSYARGKRLLSTELILKDSNEYQPFEISTMLKKAKKMLSKRETDEENYRLTIGIEIMEVYAGTKYADICISEIKQVAK